MIKENSNVEPSTEAGNIAKPLLGDVLNRLGFVQFLKSKNWWIRKVYNDSICQFDVYARLLNDNETVRISVAEKDTDEMEAVDLFETKRYLDIDNFFNVVG
jgi:hypothetical protein